MCLVVLVLGLVALGRSLSQSDIKSIGVSLALIAISVATAFAANRSGRSAPGMDTLVEGG